MRALTEKGRKEERDPRIRSPATNVMWGQPQSLVLGLKEGGTHVHVEMLTDYLENCVK